MKILQLLNTTYKLPISTLYRHLMYNGFRDKALIADVLKTLNHQGYITINQAIIYVSDAPSPSILVY